MRSKNNCRKVNKKMNAYIDGELNAYESKAIAAHISSCVRCSEEYTALIDLNEKLGVFDEKECPDSLKRKLKLIRQKDTPKITYLHLPNFLKPIPIAASILLAIFSGLYVGNRLVQEYAQKSPTDYEVAQESLYSLWQEVVYEQ